MPNGEPTVSIFPLHQILKSCDWYGCSIQLVVAWRFLLYPDSSPPALTPSYLVTRYKGQIQTPFTVLGRMLQKLYGEGNGRPLQASTILNLWQCSVNDELAATCFAMGGSIVETVRYNIWDTNPIMLPPNDNARPVTNHVAVRTL